MVPEGNVESAYSTLNGILTMDGLAEDIKRISHIMRSDKINFLRGKNQADPWQGC
ncbi:28S ribosomal protein S21, mitochondrial-like [Papio anubis]|uniref:28S ribosomal protein S21, mitochondrial-like n=1 Tax=Papio anubis TaxID=9555 RepID=UPI0012AD7699|nr:28S ribosomal protein S21, mitochondrial-like [Papio anubis]